MNPSKILFVTLVMITSFSCNRTEKKDDKSKLPVKPNLSQEVVIDKMNYYVRNSTKKIMILANYYEWETRRVPCSQYDIERGKNVHLPLRWHLMDIVQRGEGLKNAASYNLKESVLLKELGHFNINLRMINGM